MCTLKTVAAFHRLFITVVDMWLCTQVVTHDSGCFRPGLENATKDVGF